MGYYSKVFSHQKNIPLIRVFLVVLYRIGSTLTPFGFACYLASGNWKFISLKASPKKQQNVRCQSQESTAMYLQKNRHWGKCRNADPPGCSNMNTCPNATSSQHMMIDLGEHCDPASNHPLLPYWVPGSRASIGNGHTRFRSDPASPFTILFQCPAAAAVPHWLKQSQ